MALQIIFQKQCIPHFVNGNKCQSHVTNIKWIAQIHKIQIHKIQKGNTETINVCALILKSKSNKYNFVSQNYLCFHTFNKFSLNTKHFISRHSFFFLAWFNGSFHKYTNSLLIPDLKKVNFPENTKNKWKQNNNTICVYKINSQGELNFEDYQSFPVMLCDIKPAFKKENIFTFIQSHSIYNYHLTNHVSTMFLRRKKSTITTLSLLSQKKKS